MIKLLKSRVKYLVSGLVTNIALTTVENKISDVSDLVKKQIVTQNC